MCELIAMKGSMSITVGNGNDVVGLAALAPRTRTRSSVAWWLIARETPMAVNPIKIVRAQHRQRRGDRVAQICAYLDAQQADVIVLTEWRDTTRARQSPHGPERVVCTGTG